MNATRTNTMLEMRFAPLAISRSGVYVSWTVEPPTPLYARTHFSLDFGDALDPRTLPLKLWWTVVLMCLHSHWNILRPCRIILPVTLPDAEIEFWQRLLDLERANLEWYRQTTDFARTVEIVCDGPVLADNFSPRQSGQHATAFSGGKDSLLQTALLCEWSERPLLVNVHSPMPPFLDHSFRYRQRALEEIVERRSVELVVVESDLRSIGSHYEAPHRLGYPVSMGQLTDPMLMTAVTFALAVSRGAASVSLASEFEGFFAWDYHGYAVSIPNMLTYSAPFYLALDQLFQTSGIRFGSLLAPLAHFQIEQLLCQRHRDLLELQISCFNISDENQQSCSRCHKCLRIAMMLLALGQDPRVVGIDLDVVLQAQQDYDPDKYGARGGSISYACSLMDVRALRHYFPPRNLWQTLGWQEHPSMHYLKKIIRLMAPDAQSWPRQHRIEYLSFVAAPLREQLLALAREYWSELDPRNHDAELDLIRRNARWVTQPLAHQS